MATRRRRRLPRLLLQLLVCAVLLELGLHLATPLSERLRVLLHNSQQQHEYGSLQTLPQLLSTTIIGHSPYLEHGGFLLNSRGLRTPEYELDPPADSLRLVALGDSFTFSCSGMPQEFFWLPRVTSALSTSQGRPAQLINLGVPGTGPAFYKRIWELEGARLSPHLVLIGVFVGNDFSDGLGQGGVGAWLAGHSLVLRLARNLVRVAGAGIEPGQGASRPGARLYDSGGFEIDGYARIWSQRKPKLASEALVRLEARRSWVCEKRKADRFERSLDSVAGTLDELCRSIAASGARCLVVLIPDRFQVEDEMRQAVLGRVNQPDDAFDWERPQRRLREQLARSDTPCLDLLDDFRAAAATQTLYGEGDTHWSQQGCALAAQSIVARLQAEAPLPERDG